MSEYSIDEEGKCVKLHCFYRNAKEYKILSASTLPEKDPKKIRKGENGHIRPKSSFLRMTDFPN